MKFLKFTNIILAITLSFYLGSLNALTKSDPSIIGKLKELESKTEGRLGIFAVNTENGHVIEYRANEIFPTGCTSKVIGVAAVLNKSMSNPSLLSTKVKYSKDELDEWSPVTAQHVSDGMTIQELCSASISLSDNTAMNLLLRYIGGVQGMNDFARSIGDSSFRQDNDWPAEAFSGGPNNVKDSSTPKAMVESLRKLTLGEVLNQAQRDLLTTWLRETSTGSKRIRASIPKNWLVGNKTGSGARYGSTNDLAIIWPSHHAPLLIGAYYTTDNQKASKREDIIAAATKLIVEELIINDTKLEN